MKFNSTINYVFVICSCFLINGCDSVFDVTSSKTASKDFFEDKIIPVLENRCLSCHGVSEDAYSDFMSDENKTYFYFPVTIDNKVSDIEMAYKVSISHHRVEYAEAAEFSHIVRAPLTEEYGGVAHKGLDIFYSSEDADYKLMLEWLTKEISAHPEKEIKLSASTQYFKDEVQPALVRNSCFLSSCHGPASFTDLKLLPPLPNGQFSNAMTHKNKASLLGDLTRLVNLGGDLKLSRVLVKNIPIKEGGVHQRGGNNQFFENYDDADVKKLLQWMAMERDDLFKHLTIQGKPLVNDLPGDVKGFVFIRGPRHMPRKYFSFDEFYPGSNIYYFDGVNEKQITFFKNAEIQSLDVSYDAKKIVFSRKHNKDSGFRIFEIDLKSKEIKQLSISVDNKNEITHHIDPIYSPNYSLDHKSGYDLSDVVITYASNAAGDYVASEAWGIIGEADNTNKPSKIVIIDKQRHEKAGTFNNLNLSFVKGPNKGLWRKIIKHTKNKLILDKALPHDLDINSIYVIEQPHRNYSSAYDIWRFTPGSFKKSNVRMTWGFNQDRRPTVRTSGEVMATSVRNLGYQDDKPVFNGAIFRMQAGGFDFHPHGGERSQYALHSDAREMPQGLEVKTLHDPRNYWGGGQLALVDHGFGSSTEANNPMDNIPLTEKYDEVTFSSLPRYISEMVVFDKNINHTGVSEGGAYRDPFPVVDGSILVAHVTDQIDHLDKNADPDWDIYRIVFAASLQAEDRHQIGEYKKIRLDKVSTDAAEFNPRPVVIRLHENRHHPLEHQKFIQGHKPEILHGIKRMPAGTPAEIEIYDFSLLVSFLTNFTQTGSRNILPDGVIKYVRAIGVMPLTKQDTQNIIDADPFATAVSKGVHTKKLIIGEVELASDSSMYVEVPSNVAWIVQALDKDKRALYTLQRMFYTQPGERFTLSIPRSKFVNACGGCHGSLTSDPMQGIGPADIVTEASKVIATWNKQEKKRRSPAAKGAKLTDYISIDFVKDIQPILNKHCIECHNRGGLNLTDTKTRHYNQAYETLHQLRDPQSRNFADKKYINEREALSSQSFLIDKLMSKDHHYLNDAELLMLIRWIDIGATYKGVF